MRKNKKLSRIETRTANLLKLQSKLSGTGLYKFQNNTKGTLSLPKPASDGTHWPLAVGGMFQGDSYFMQFVKTHELTLVEVLPEVTQERNTMTEDKLILDQPAQVTIDGTIEHVVKKTVPIQPPKPLNEVLPQTGSDSAILINEEPLDGVEIILG